MQAPENELGSDSESAARPLAIVHDNEFDVAIVDDHDTFSMSLKIALRRWGIRAQQVRVADLAEFAARPHGGRPGVVVLDLYLGLAATGGRVHGGDWIGWLIRSNWRVLVVTGSEDPSDRVAAIAQGAAGVLSKAISLDDLITALIRVAAGEPLIGAGERRALEAQHWRENERRQRIDALLSTLTTRERVVLDAIAEGHHANDIAKTYVVALPTIRSQIRSILSKLKVNSQIEAVALLHQQSVSPNPREKLTRTALHHGQPGVLHRRSQ